ncbi:MAG: NADPH-dependent F420 reductase, partial [Bryobacteraceae bacterium]
LAAAGFPVSIGSRDAAKAHEKAVHLGSQVAGAAISGGENTAVVREADIVFLSVPFDSAEPLIDACRESWKSGTVVVDSTVPLRFESGRPVLLDLKEGSASEHLARALPPGVALVAAFKTIPAHILAEVDVPLDCDLMVCGDHTEAKARVMEVASAITGLRPLDAGPLRNARILEAMCVLAISLNRRYKSKAARFRIVGI